MCSSVLLCGSPSLRCIYIFINYIRASGELGEVLEAQRTGAVSQPVARDLLILIVLRRKWPPVSSGALAPYTVCHERHTALHNQLKQL